jgi:hypothetical protein
MILTHQTSLSFQAPNLKHQRHRKVRQIVVAGGIAVPKPSDLELPADQACDESSPRNDDDFLKASVTTASRKNILAS